MEHTRVLRIITTFYLMELMRHDVELERTVFGVCMQDIILLDIPLKNKGNKP
jgi:hypothetical protein